MVKFKYDAIIFTLTDQLEHIETIVRELPHIKITIAAPVYFSDKILKLTQFENVTLETILNDEKLSYLLDKADLLLDINHDSELYDVCSKFKAADKEIVAFKNTAHCPKSATLFDSDFPETLINYLKENNFRKEINQVHKIWMDGDYNRFQISQGAKFVVGHNVIGRSFISFNINGTIYFEQNVFFNSYCSFNCLDRIEIGEDTMIGEGVRFYDHDHTFSSHQIDKWNYKTAPIKIGKKCWIGSNVTVLKGVTIGDNVVIGAGCLIRKDIPSNSIVYNNGDLIIKER